MNKTANNANFNLGRKACRRRLIASIAGAAVTVGMFMIMRWTQAERLWYLLLFAPALFAVLGLLQAQAKTCVVLAARGLRDLDQGEEKIGDSYAIQLLRRRAMIIYLKSLALALAFTAIIYWTS